MKFRRKIALILAMLFCMETVAQAKVLVDEKGTESEICSEVVFDGETYLKSQRYDDIYENGDQYVMIVTDEDNSEELTVIPMERKDINFDDEDAVEMFLNRKDIPKEAIESFKEKYQSYLALEEDENVQPTLTTFEPASVATTRGAGSPDYITTYTYNGWPMQTYHFNYGNLSTGWKTIEKGRKTKDVIKLVSDVALSIAGAGKGKKLSFFSTGKSILDAFLTYAGIATSNELTTNVSDYFQVRLLWDQNEKYTMTDRGGMTGWQTGLITYKVTVKKLGQETYFAKSGKEPNFSDRPYNEEIKSEHFNNPWETAFKNGDLAVREYVSWSTGGVSFNFN